MNPFRYPKHRHRRRFAPPAFTDYRSYKPFLQDEFERQCVYCRLPDTLGHDFGVDHYRPASRFPQLKCEYRNLFYACNVCNRRKGAYWPDDGQRRAGHLVPNPCDHVMFDHLRYAGGVVSPHSDAGRFTIEALDLNDADFTGFRELIIDAIGRFEAERAKHLRTLGRIDKLQTEKLDEPAVLARLAIRLSEAQSRLTKVDQRLARLSGKPSGTQLSPGTASPKGRHGRKGKRG